MKLKILNEGVDNNFMYSSVIDYESDGYGCVHECDTDDYCRCATYNNLRAANFNAKALVEHFLAPTSRKLIQAEVEDMTFMDYCVDRIISVSKITEENFDISVSPGYYGEEIRSITMENDVFLYLEEQIEELAVLSPSDRVRHVLKEEYSYLLPEIATAEFEERVVPTDQLRFPSTTQMIKASLIHPPPPPVYQIGIYRQVTKDKYEVVDGYHRLNATLTSKVPTARIIVF